MAKLSSTLLPSTNSNTTGIAYKGSGYRNVGTGQHTVSIQTNAFTGRVHIEASLASIPESTDWFPIKLDGENEYLSFTTDSDTYYYVFTGNFIWVRAKISNRTAGSVDKILLSF
jgi:hypothetical protein